MRISPLSLLASVVLAGCAGSNDGGTPADSAAAAAAAVTGPDPCTLVSQDEMEELIGPLAEPPYRVDADRRPRVDGEGCFYRARDRRNVTLLVDFVDGPLSFSMLAGTGKSVTDVLMGYDAATDTLEGKWDQIGAAFGQLIVLKDSVSVQVDPFGSRIGLPGAVRVAALAVGRIGRPLDYNGARATVAHREPEATPRNPCDLVTRAEVEALMGALESDPKPTADGTGCEFATKLEFFGSKVSRTLEVTWTDGFHLLGQEASAMGGAAKIMANQMDADLPRIGQDTVGEAEPWDQRVTLVGGVIHIVKGDVGLRIAGDGVGGFDEARALALLRLAARRL